MEESRCPNAEITGDMLIVLLFESLKNRQASNLLQSGEKMRLNMLPGKDWTSGYGGQAFVLSRTSDYIQLLPHESSGHLKIGIGASFALNL